MKGFFAVFEDSNESENEKEVKEIDIRNTKNEGKGFQTLIPDEVFEKCKDLVDAHVELRKTLGKHLPEIQSKTFALSNEDTFYAMAEYIMFQDIMKEAWDKITDLVCIHEYASKELVDDECKNRGMTPRELVTQRMLEDMMEIMSR